MLSLFKIMLTITYASAMRVAKNVLFFQIEYGGLNIRENINISSELNNFLQKMPSELNMVP